jgi:hypothetical protein
MVKTPADLMFEAEKGPIARDPSSGRLLRGLFAYNPDTVKRLTASMLGTT